MIMLDCHHPPSFAVKCSYSSLPSLHGWTPISSGYSNVLLLADEESESLVIDVSADIKGSSHFPPSPSALIFLSVSQSAYPLMHIVRICVVVQFLAAW